MNDFVKLGKAEVRRDLEQHRRVARLLTHALARIDHLGKEIVEDVPLLQVAQARRIRRGHIDGEIARDWRESLDQPHVVGNAIRRILVGAEIDADDARKICAHGEPPQHRISAVIVEAQAIDHGLVALEAEQARPSSLRETARATEQGGLSGRPLFRLSTRMVAETFVRVEGAFPLIGVGGIDSSGAALTKIRAGASLIQLYSSLIYRGLGIIDEIKNDLAATLLRTGREQLSEIVGADAAAVTAEDWPI